MFKHIAAFEWRYQLRSPVFWVGCLIFFLRPFGAATVDTIQLGSRGNVNINSPFALLQTMGIMGVFAVFIVVAMVAGTVIRDDETGFAPILRSTRIGKGAYLGGRFSGAMAAALAVLAAVPLANALGAAMPWLDVEKVGPFIPGHYLYALCVFGLPTLLITGAVFFALATATRSLMWTYVGAVALLVMFTVTRVWLRDSQYDAVSALSDPFGVSALSIVTKYWTAAERNTLLSPLTELLGANRLPWLGVAAAMFGLAWRLFHFEQRATGTAATPLQAEPAAAPAAPPRSASLAMPRHDAPTRRAQLWAMVRFDMGFVFRNPALFVLLGIGVLNAGGSAWFVGTWYGSESWPATRLMVQTLQGAFTIMPVIIAIYYGGELVWRDRERRLHEIIDATAAPDWAHLLPKILAITGVLAASTAVAVLTGMAVQAAKGYFQFELGAYLLWFALPTLITAVQLAVLSVFVQVLVPQKFIGWGLMLLQVVAMVALASAGFEHNLYNYAGTPPVPLSDMNGMARFWIGQAWFQVYWSALATVLAVAAHLLWRRGTSTALRPRLAALPRRLRGGAAVLGGAGLLVWLGSGAIIFYNTNLLNRYQTAPERDAALADVERALLPFESLPLPRITAVTLDVQFYPRQARAVTTGRYQLENRGTVAIEQLHIHWPERLTIDQLVLDGAVLEKQYPRFAYRIYRLQPAMQPGEVRELRFVTTLEERGFTNGAPLHRLVANGSFVDNSEITPSLGMSRDGLLTDRAKRRKYGLPPDVRPPKLEDEAGRARNEFSAASDGVHADITMGTDADQTPIAPGYQWWGHQLLPSHQQGATLLVESLAQYSALLVMERMYGKEQMRRFLKYELDRYLRQRGSEAMEELPLARVENQQYIHYQKGSLAMYWLKEVVGEAAVNRALARLLKAHAFKPAPYPNALDFLRLMREEAGPAHDALITDLFEKITLLDVKASNASAVKLADGRWQVSFDVVAAKRYADGQGQQTDAPLAEPFDIGVFSAEPGKPGYNAASVLLFDRQRIKTGTQRLTVMVAQQPAFVGVDPYNKRIDRNADDNLVRVEKP